MVTPAAHREAAVYLQSTYEMSQRRACLALGTDRSSMRYRATRPADAALRERLKALAAERRRFGYRRLHVLLRREGRLVNRKRVQRIYREERLMVRRRGGRKRAMGADSDDAAMSFRDHAASYSEMIPPTKGGAFRRCDVGGLSGLGQR
jgi:putative transposase